MPEIHLIDFFDYYKGTPEQKEAVQLLQQSMPDSLLKNKSSWVVQYRKKPPAPPTPDWPLTKAELGEIMQCSPNSLPDPLMDDLARCCEDFGITNRVTLGYFLGQCGHESAGLRYPVEIASGAAYEGRSDLGNTQPGDGVKWAGTGWIQVTGRYNHQRFSDYLTNIGKPDPKIMEIGKTYTSEVYPWSISGYWWKSNGMNEFCAGNPSIDSVGARVNGKMPPNGAQDRRDYTNRAFKVLGV